MDYKEDFFEEKNVYEEDVKVEEERKSKEKNIYLKSFLKEILNTFFISMLIIFLALIILIFMFVIININ
jgi:lipopolysaccharide/colanic/teichoic acid biosynthesis glycosyltransferase